MIEKAFHFEATCLLEALTEARHKVVAIDTLDFSLVRNKIINQLTGMINKVRFEQLGLEPIPYEAGDIIAEDKEFSSKPLTKILGIDLVSQESKLSPEKIEFQELKSQVNDLYEEFLETSNEVILDKTPEIVIRGLAKKLNLPVTETHPKRIDLTFVEQLRGLIEQREKSSPPQVDDGAETTSLPN